MGMFDYVNFQMACPKCGASVKGFQSKDCYCVMETIEPDTVSNFYASCDKCRTWIEFSRYPETKPPREKPLTLDEVMALGFQMETRN